MNPQSFAKSNELSVSLASPSQSDSLLTKCASYRRLAHASRRLKQTERDDLRIWLVRANLSSAGKRQLNAKTRIVAQTPHFVLYCPFASRFPYEAWIMPREHVSQYESSDIKVLRELSGLMRAHVDALERLFPETPYNYWIQTAPFGVADCNFFHWRIQLMPRVTSQAGYEWGTGCFVNPVAPETAAENLRNSTTGVA